MDVYFCNYRNCNDGSTCLCSTCHMANKGILPLFTSGIDVGESLCLATCAQPAIDVFLFLDVFLDFFFWILGVLRIHGDAAFWGGIYVTIDYNTMHVDAVLNDDAAIQPPILAPSHGGQKGAEGSIGG